MGSLLLVVGPGRWLIPGEGQGALDATLGALNAVFIDATHLEAHFIYLSFVTQTTLGYDDVTPTTMASQSLAILHASSAVLYVAALVAWLVASIKPAADGG